MNKKIFIVEDDANILYGLQALFRVSNFEVEINNGGDSKEVVINEIKKFKPDYIVLDLILPKISGFEMARELQADDETSNIDIFAFTSLSDQDSRERGVNSGINYYFLKTELDIEELVEKIKKIIKNKEKLK